MKINFFLLILFLIGISPSLYADTSLNAVVDKKRVYLNENLTYTVNIVSDERNIPPLNLPKFNDFLVISKNYSSNIIFQKGKFKTLINYEFILCPLKTGKLTIEPAQLKIKNKVLRTESIEIEVINEEQPLPQTPSPKESPLPQDLSPEEKTIRYTI